MVVLDRYRLIEARTVKLWNQNDTAIASKVSTPSIIKAERGLPIRESTAGKICAALGLDLARVVVGRTRETRRPTIPA